MLNITPQQWAAAVEQLFADEAALIKKAQQFKAIDTADGLARLQWIINNNWRHNDALDAYVNQVTGETATRAEIRALYEQSKTKK